MVDMSILPMPGNGIGESKDSFNTSLLLLLLLLLLVVVVVVVAVVAVVVVVVAVWLFIVESGVKSLLLLFNSNKINVFSSTHNTNREGVSLSPSSSLLLLLLLLLLLFSLPSPVWMPTARSINGALTLG